MAPEAPLVGYQLRSFFLVAMAVKAGKPGHAHAVDDLVRVAAAAGLRIWGEIMYGAGVAFLASDVQHKYMPCMTI